MMFADFSMGEAKEEERGGLFTRHDYGTKRCNLGCLAARRSLSHFIMRSVPEMITEEVNIKRVIRAKKEKIM